MKKIKFNNKKQTNFEAIVFLLLLSLIFFLASCGNNVPVNKNVDVDNSSSDSNSNPNAVIDNENDTDDANVIDNQENAYNVAAIDNSKTEIGVMTQEYIDDNIAEILIINYDGQQPAFEEYGWKNPEIEMINNITKFGIQQIYNDFMYKKEKEGLLEEREWIEIRSYPFTSDEWLQIVTSYNVYPTYGISGNVESYNFNKKENSFVTIYDAMEKEGITEENLVAKVKELFTLQCPYMSVDEVKATGFLIKEGAEKPFTQFLLEITAKNSESDLWQGLFSYVHESSELSELDVLCLFDPYDMDEMNPPLSYQRTNEYGGVTLDESAAMDLLRDALSSKIEEMNANVFKGNTIAIVGYGDEIINGTECWSFALGTDSPEKFTAEEFYAVTKVGGIIYYMNIFNEGKYDKYIVY